MKEFNGLALILIWLLAMGFIFSSCTCNGKDTDDDTDDDTNDDTNDDNTDDDDDDDDTQGWHVYTIDPKTGYESSIAIDSNNKVHVSYGKYATNKSGTWQIFEISAGPSIAIDSNDKVHICGIANGDVRYTTNRSGTWQSFVIDDNGDNNYCAIAVDSNGKVHISYQLCDWDYDHCSIGDLKYATNKSGSWHIQTVDSLEDTGWHTDISVDSNGKVYISYYSPSELKYRYATNKSGSWSRADVYSGPNIPDEAYNSIALDSSGKVHMSFFHETGLYYATNKLGGWQSFLIEPDFEYDDVGLFNSIALDSSDKVHISYYYDAYDYGSGDDSLRYATNKSGTWEVITVDSKGDVGLYTSIAIDSDNYVHISYRDNTNDHLKYATNRPPK